MLKQKISMQTLCINSSFCKFAPIIDKYGIYKEKTDKR